MKRGIALEGGGAKGAFHVGAMKAIHELGIQYHGVVGASIGAINGAIIAMQDMALLEEIWLSTEARDIIKGDDILLDKVLKLDFSGDIAEIRRVIIETIKQGGLDVSPYRQYLKTHINESRIRQSEIAYGLVTLSLTDLKPIEVFVENIPEGKLHDYIIASANFPAFKTGKIDDKYLLDGGFFDNLPINMLFDKGYDEVIAIRIMGMGRIRPVQKSKQDKVITIMPSEDLGKTLEIDPKRAAYNIKLGYYDAYRVLKGLKGENYYIKGEFDEACIMKTLFKLPPEMIQKLKQLLGNENMVDERFVFEFFIPLLMEVLGLSKSAGYGDMVLAFFEALATDAHINRLRFLTLGELIQNVATHYAQDEKGLIKTLDSLSMTLLNLVKTTGVGIMPSKQKMIFLKYLLYLMLQSGLTFTD